MADNVGYIGEKKTKHHHGLAGWCNKTRIDWMRRTIFPRRSTIYIYIYIYMVATWSLPMFPYPYIIRTGSYCNTPRHCKHLISCSFHSPTSPIIRSLTTLVCAVSKYCQDAGRSNMTLYN